MKPTRREFLKLSGIGTLGAVIFNGCGIPEEEITIQSSAQMPEDLVSGLEAWYATSCGHCSVNEGIIVRVIEGRAIKIEGNPDHPVNRGKTSVRCQSGLQELYNPDRLTGPLRRNGERGSGSFEPISWEEAIDEMLSALRSANGSKSVLATEPLSGSINVIANKFMDSYGGQLIAHDPVDQTVLHQAVKDVFGQDKLPEFDIARATHILSFGADFLGSWLSPVHYAKAYGEFRQGLEGNSPATRNRGTLTQVEPRFSLTAANADQWIYVNPGWEGVLALSIAAELISSHSDRLDPTAVKDLTSSQGADALSAFSPNLVADRIGISEAQIKHMASDLAGSPQSLVIGGGSAGAHSNGLYNLTAIYSLNYLLGSVGKLGGVVFNPTAPIQEAEQALSSLNDWQQLADRMRQGNVELFMVRGVNPVHGLPRGISFEDALSNVRFVISFSSFMDETSIVSDLILPEPTYLETWGDNVPNPGPGYKILSLQQPIVKPFEPTSTRPFADLLLLAAENLGGDISKALPWRSLKDLLRENVWKLHDLGNGSVNGGTREEFWNAVLQRGGWWDTNSRNNSATSKRPILATRIVEPEFTGNINSFPFHLVPFSSLSLGEGKGANLPWLQATPDPVTTAVWHTWAEINLKYANDNGIEEGDVLAIEAPDGSRIEALAYPHPAAAPNVVAIPFGLGHTVYGDFEIGDDLHKSKVGKGRGANVFDVIATNNDKDTGGLAWASTRVNITKTGKWTRLSKLEGTVPAQGLPEDPVILVTRPT